LTRKSSEPTSSDFVKASRKVTLIGALLDAVLGLSKIFGGIATHSYSLVADGIHSLSDLASDFMVLIITSFSRNSPDSDHPYGHARFETLATVLLGCLLLAVAVTLAYENSMRFLRAENLLIPSWPALLIALISIASKEWIYRYTARVAKDYQSDLLLANAWHSRTDALSSLVVFIGVAGSMMGIVWMDLLAALLVAVIIGRIAIIFIWRNVQQLVDTGLPKEKLGEIVKLARSVEGVLNVHDLRTRSMGSEAFIEIHIQVNPWLSASEGHFIGNQVSKAILQQVSGIGDIVFHIDTEHEDHDDFANLPSRSAITHLLKTSLPDIEQHAQLEKTKLHYLNGAIAIEVLLSTNNQEYFCLAQQKAKEMVEKHAWLSSIHLWK